MQTWKVDPDRPDPGDLRRAARLLADGGVLAVPTETYYGLAADLRRPQALRRVQALKGRGSTKPLLLLVDSVATARRLAPHASSRLETLAERFWPGALTLVLEAREGLPGPVLSPSGGVAVRQSPHPVIVQLLNCLGSPVTGTSANLAGRPPARLASEIDLGGASLDGILDAGPTPGGPPSTLLDLTSVPPRILRAGAVAPEDLAALL